MKRIKKLIVILLVIILILILGILIINMKNKEKKVENLLNTETSVDPGVPEEDINKNAEDNNILQYVTDRNYYAIIKAISRNYISVASYGERDIIRNIFSNKFIEEYKINDNNILSYTGVDQVSNTKINSTYIISDMLYTVKDNIYIYIVKGKYRFSNWSNYRELNLMIVLDDTNEKYVLFPDEYLKKKNYSNLKENDILKLDNTILSSEKVTSFSRVSLDDKEYSNELFAEWKEKIIYDKKDAYSKLNNQYKEKRFSNYNSFTDYLSNKKYIPTINQYRVYSKDDYTDYICTDQYNNYYIFRVQGGVMRYTVFLDNYTVELESFKENYDKSDDSGKIAIQTGKFKQMLNLKDYNAIYSKLNEKFKDNNFKTVSDLKKYLDEKIYNINTIEIQEITQKDDYYVCNGVIRNQQNQNEQKSIVIAIKLIGSNEFELSFSIK